MVLPIEHLIQRFLRYSGREFDAGTFWLVFRSAGGRPTVCTAKIVVPVGQGDVSQNYFEPRAAFAFDWRTANRVGARVKMLE
jgi:hypothetical protein